VSSVSDEDELVLPDVSVCLCDHCPDVTDEHSKCCFNEAKIKEVCSNEGVVCITKVAKMAKLWDKVI
jgi:hypothetical protein